MPIISAIVSLFLVDNLVCFFAPENRLTFERKNSRKRGLCYCGEIYRNLFFNVFQGVKIQKLWEGGHFAENFVMFFSKIHQVIKQKNHLVFKSHYIVRQKHNKR